MSQSSNPYLSTSYNDDNLASKIHAPIRLTSITTPEQVPFFSFQWTIPRTPYAR